MKPILAWDDIKIDNNAYGS